MLLRLEGQARGPAHKLREDQLISRKKWIAFTLEAIGEARRTLERWLHELEIYVSKTDDLETQEEQERDQAICERARMVLMAGSALYTQTELYKIETGLDSVEGEWDLEVARRTHSALQKAADVTSDYPGNKPFQTNCRERLERVSKRWRNWCPALAKELQEQEA